MYTKRRCIRTLVLGIILLSASDSLHAATLDPNFTESTFYTFPTFAAATGMAWAPDGSNRLFITRKAGEIRIVKDGALLAAPFATLSPIVTTSECGLIGICFDPNFINNGYVYVFVTVSSTQQQIIRYTASGDTGINKTTIVSGLPTTGANHDGGGLGIGPDGKLYWAVGDNGNATGVDGDLASLASKVGRANLDGTVPSDNPFVDGPGGNNDYIWARGFRNPFTLTFQPNTGELWVNCVGTSYEQVFLVRKGDHAGWNDYENNQPSGYITPKIKYRTNNTDTRSLAAGSGAVRNANVVTFTTSTAHGFRQGEKITIAGVTDGSFNGSFFVTTVPSTTTFTVAQTGPNATSGSGSATTLNQGGCISGGCFFDSSAVPAAYRGNFFYGDYNSDRVMRATLNTANEITSVDYLSTGITDHIDTSLGPDGALYFIGLPGAVTRLAWSNYAAQQLIVTPLNVRMVENGRAAVSVRLAQAPASDVTVNVSRIAGDANVSVASGSNLVFTAANWSTPQTVQIAAAADSDTTNATAQFQVSSAGLASESVMAYVLDTITPFAVGPITSTSPGTFPIQVGLSGETGTTYVLEAATNLTSGWTPVSTNTLISSSTNILDPASSILPQRFYRARLPGT